MTRGIYTKWIIGGAFILLIVATGCILYYQHTTAADKQAAEQADKLLQQWKADKADKAQQTTTADKKVINTPAESTQNTAEKPTTDTTQDNETPTIIIPLEMNVPLKEKSKRISPHAFGEYPEVPKDAPINPFTGNETRDMELLKRVAIKAWNNGERFDGASTDSQYGKVYLHYPNTIYVEYDDPIEEPDGTIRISITRVKGTGDVQLTTEQMDKGEIPASVNILSIRDDGIDPYAYLNLQ